MSGGTHGRANRLARERSPYLLQHAHNPVEWWPWGAEAIEEARRLDRPLFLSIGYATCHWCHVMARESFEDPLIGRLLSERFVSVKVDREERPEVDEVCMTACQIFTQIVEGRPSGGWPLSIWLEPRTLAPFFVGTYFPPEPSHGRPSFSQVIQALGSAWRDRRAEIEAQAERLLRLVGSQLGAREEPVEIPPSIVQESAARLMAIHDLRHGGFGGAPKFPQACALELLIEAAQQSRSGQPASGEPSSGGLSSAARTSGGSASGGSASGGSGSGGAILDAVRRTLVSMARGGIHDQVGGGFHRYAVDREWVVPHFEKMLYDQGQLASLYARASLVFVDPRMLSIAARTCMAGIRELGMPGGASAGGRVESAGTEPVGSVAGAVRGSARSVAFACARDAEAAGREGVGYIWTRESFERAFVDAGRLELHAAAAVAFGLDGPANFRDPHHADAPPSWVLVDRTRWAGLTREEHRSLQAMRELLRAARSRGPRPAMDDKVVPAWNGLMIEGLVETSRAIREWLRGTNAGELVDPDRECSADAADSLMEAARDAASFILSSMRDADGGLFRVWRAGSAGVPAVLEDYGLMARGLAALAMAERIGDRAGDAGGTAQDAERWLSEAEALLAEAQQRFADERGGWFDAPVGTLLPIRARSLDDGAMPSGTTAMVGAHLRVAELLDSLGGVEAARRARRHRDRAVAAIRAASATIVANPLGSMGLLAEISRLRRASPGIV